MVNVAKKIFLGIILLLPGFMAIGQESLLSPEVEQMDRHAQEYVGLGNYKEAIIIYRQAIALAPGKFILYECLGNALYLSGSYTETEQVLRPLLEKPEVNADCYLLLAESQAAQSNTKAARATLNKGLVKFPASGELYNGLGTIFKVENKLDAALDAWLSGIRKAPGYPQNYYEAARVYMDTANGVDNIMWGLVYGEIYLDIAQDTMGENAFKKMLFTGYKTMFDNIVPAHATGSGKAKVQASPGSFAAAMRQVYLSLTPVVSDGITTENLTMVRTRFLMDWYARYADKYPFTLFAYQDRLLRNGLFDMYNEWLFGKAESRVEYDAWNQFHPGELEFFLQKKKQYPLLPVSGDAAP